MSRQQTDDLIERATRSLQTGRGAPKQIELRRAAVTRAAVRCGDV